MMQKLGIALKNRFAAVTGQVGAVSVEYVLLVAAVAAAIIAGTLILGPKITSGLSNLL